MKSDPIIHEMDQVIRNMDQLPEEWPTEVTDVYKQMLEKLRSGLAAGKNLDDYSEETGDRIRQMMSCFEKALTSHKEKTATQILASVSESLRLLEEPYLTTETEEYSAIIHFREETVQRLELLVRFQDFYDGLELRIQKMKLEEEQYLQDAENAENRLLELSDLRDYYEQKVVEISERQESPSPDVLDYINRVDTAAEARNNYNRHVMMRQILLDRSQTILKAIHRINMIAFGTTEILGQETIEDLEQAINLFEENVIAQQKENQKLDQLTEHFDSIQDIALERISKKMQDLPDVKDYANQLDALKQRKNRMEQQHTDKFGQRDKLEESSHYGLVEEI